MWKTVLKSAFIFLPLCQRNNEEIRSCKCYPFSIQSASVDIEVFLTVPDTRVQLEVIFSLAIDCDPGLEI